MAKAWWPTKRLLDQRAENAKLLENTLESRSLFLFFEHRGLFSASTFCVLFLALWICHLHNSTGFFFQTPKKIPRNAFFLSAKKKFLKSQIKHDFGSKHIRPFFEFLVFCFQKHRKLRNPKTQLDVFWAQEDVLKCSTNTKQKFSWAKSLKLTTWNYPKWHISGFEGNRIELHCTFSFFQQESTKSSAVSCHLSRSGRWCWVF